MPVLEIKSLLHTGLFVVTDELRLMGQKKVTSLRRRNTSGKEGLRGVSWNG